MKMQFIHTSAISGIGITSKNILESLKSLPAARLLIIGVFLLTSGCGSNDGSDRPNQVADFSCEQPAPTLQDVFSDAIPLLETPPLPGDSCDIVPPQLLATMEDFFLGRNALFEQTAADLLDPGKISVITCGTASAAPSDRIQACTAVFVGGKFLLFDVGDGASKALENAFYPIADLDAVFLTHFHSDHIADLGEIVSRSWINGRTTSVPVYGGPLIDRIVEGFNLIYSPDIAYRVEHHGEEAFPESSLLTESRLIEEASEDGVVVYDQDGIVVKAYKVDHSPISPALGYRVEYAGYSVGISGDTIDTAGLRNLATGADILVSEVLDKNFILAQACGAENTGDARIGRLLRDTRTYHIGVDELAQLAHNAQLTNLVLTHQVPTLPPAQAERLFAPQISSFFSGQLLVAEDGSRVTIEVE